MVIWLSPMSNIGCVLSFSMVTKAHERCGNPGVRRRKGKERASWELQSAMLLEARNAYCLLESEIRIRDKPATFASRRAYNDDDMCSFPRSYSSCTATCARDNFGEISAPPLLRKVIWYLLHPQAAVMEFTLVDDLAFFSAVVN